MSDAAVRLRVDPSLWLFLSPSERRKSVDVHHDGTSSLGHLVQSLGVPLTEVGSLLIDDSPVEASHRALGGRTFEVRAVERPQRLAGWPRFVLDVHVGSLARRLRLLGVDAAYANQADDDELVDIAVADGRILLTKDRGILRRRLVKGHAAYVRGETTDDQMLDVLDRFEPPLRPLTRCVACNGTVHPVSKDDVASRLRPGTARSYDEFSQCRSCARVYWRGAHADRIDAAVSAGVSRGGDRDLPYAEPL
jgi:uncharacterized protein with PIN domain